MEKTFSLLKPDTLKKKLVGRIISRIEDADLLIEEMRMVNASPETVKKLYPETKVWLETVGEKTLSTYNKYGLDPLQEIGTTDKAEIGRKVKGWLITYLTSGPVIIMKISGNHAVEIIRKLVGNTIPILAAPGTIRGDFSVDSPELANAERRAIANLIHASGSKEEAEFEISLWFGER